MTKTEAIAKADAHNQSINDFIAHLEFKYGNRITSWSLFMMMSDYNEQGFYHKAEPIVDALRANGINATIREAGNIVFWYYV